MISFSQYTDIKQIVSVYGKGKSNTTGSVSRRRRNHLEDNKNRGRRTGSGGATLGHQTFPYERHYDPESAS